MMKAQADIFYFLGYVFGGAIALVVLLVAFHNLFAGFLASPQVANNTYAVKAINSGEQAQSTVANALVFIFMAVALGSLFLAFFVDSSPLFLILIFICLPVEMLLSFIFHDIFFQLVKSSFLSSTVAAIPALIYFFQYLPLITLVMAVIIAIGTYSKR